MTEARTGFFVFVVAFVMLLIGRGTYGRLSGPSMGKAA
jgi:hypothetical protein